MITSKLGKGQEEKDTPPACTRTFLFSLAARRAKTSRWPDRMVCKSEIFYAGAKKCRAGPSKDARIPLQLPSQRRHLKPSSAALNLVGGPLVLRNK